ncbi:MAG: MBL fold metallo-hydrolase [Spirochaetes bacterium]|nr:MBL fold metallo-hydrolase [Spirochaetota bacterium]
MKFGYYFTDFPEFSKNEGVKFLKSSVYLIYSEIEGPMLFDTGSVYDTKSLIFFLKNYFNLNPEDINWIFITHLHPDHVGGNRLFKNAKIILSKNEYMFANSIAKTVFNKGNLLKFLLDNCPGYKNFFTQETADNMQRYIENYWSDESLGLHFNHYFIEDNPVIPEIIKILPTFGHTFNHYSYVIENKDLNILIAGDALSMRMVMRDEDEQRFFEPHMDFNLYFKSLKLIKKFEGIIAPGHDRPFYSKNLKSLRNHINTLKEIANKISNTN